LSESGIGQRKCELAALLEIPRERERPPIRINANDVALNEILQILIEGKVRCLGALNPVSNSHQQSVQIGLDSFLRS
jgi:hypothetical protein